MATLGTLRGMVRNLVLERTGDTGLITDTEANDIINAAARLLYVRIATAWGEAVAQRSAANVVVPSTGILPFNTISAAAAIVRVLDVRAGSTGNAESSMKPVRAFNNVQEKWLYDGAGTVAVPHRFFIEGTNVIFSPLPSATFDCRVTWVQMPTDMSADGDAAWGGKLVEHHDAIAFLASIMVFNKDQNVKAPFSEVFAYIEKVMTDRFGPPGPYDRPVKVK